MRKEKMKVARAPRILARLSARGFALTLAIHDQTHPDGYGLV